MESKIRGGSFFYWKIFLYTNVMQFVSDLAIKPGGYYYYSRSVFINIYIPPGSLKKMLIIDAIY